jgi:hypothetical protein
MTASLLLLGRLDQYNNRQPLQAKTPKQGVMGVIGPALWATHLRRIATGLEASVPP